MKNFLLGLGIILIATAPRALAQTAANADFNPFPQMEQDTGDNTDQSGDQADSQTPNEDNSDWPPANVDTKSYD